ncbi:Lsr2 family DNA-binding protein [Streptomyces sp. DHE17-7]|uniref:Lsr2 family DNA-binding protein n=1 Tax=Streptomyces sp. DHE17-7 TaxID=2759949 RepID=UPI0022EB07F3|nr:histone-like nucleoid-structuring protein Lsr2 [Streptomyces sp. DHE17-7]MBJ6620029.1 Lsr2 family protein [Streptomyces sp. DHE17-7]
MTIGGLSTSEDGNGFDGPSVRKWAREQGYTVRDRGRIPTAVLEAYAAATKAASSRPG